ncbi:MAG: phosphomethylpyrimidine kinase [Gammaproteobacteria bacterium RIFCSPHIGHO2_12_FULL_37_14]|nr:MAG: phosphomethylpyrimidine kinase [Gammaproteobacteria bacterium RIFCSPHIGHO2_12_FULL_37_14]
MAMPIAWTIAGSDSSGGAGVQADLKVFQQLAVHGCSVVTAVTAQHPAAVTAIQYISVENITAQMMAMRDYLPPKAIKIGMLGHEHMIDTIVTFLRSCQSKIVFDPVMVASSGQSLFKQHQKKYLDQLNKLFPYVDLLTPNLLELSAFLNRPITSYADIEEAAHFFIERGVKSILIKGGHFQHDKMSQDYWSNGSESFWLASSRYPEKNYHGTGCIYSSAITASLALGYDLKSAIVIAKMYINRGIRLAQPIDQNTAYLMHANWPENEIDLPIVSQTPVTNVPIVFPSCGKKPLGLYPIVNEYEWLKKLLPTGISTIQLRIKNKTGNALAMEIQKSIQLAMQYSARLFINDHWELAIQYGGYGVHLGQTDLNEMNVSHIKQAGLRLGISTHCYYEVARAHGIRPSYLACGPIFHTNSKPMSFFPQGIAQLQRWRRTLSTYPLVAIGGINESNMAAVWKTGVDGIAMISAITSHKLSLLENIHSITTMQTK